MCKRQAHSSRGSRCLVYHLQGLSRSPAAPAALSRHFMDWGHTARSRLGGFHRGSSRCLMPRSISGCMRTKTRRASARCLPLVAFACALAPTACGPSSPIAYCHLRPRMHARMAICPSCRRRRCRCAYHVNNVSQRPLSFATAHVRRRGKGVSAGTFQHPCTPFPHAREWQASMPALLRAIGLNRASYWLCTTVSVLVICINSNIDRVCRSSPARVILLRRVPLRARPRRDARAASPARHGRTREHETRARAGAHHAGSADLLRVPYAR